MLQDRGEDVVAGIIETHRRAETEALLDKLEVIPRRRVEYQGMVLSEFDLDAVIKKKAGDRPHGRASPH